MHVIRQYEFGPADTLRYEQADDPRPGEGQVRIAVQAAGVHLIDTVLRAGVRRGSAPRPELPTVPGREVAGTVDACGPGVDAVWLGRRVVAHLGTAGGGYAEMAVAGVGALHEIPAHLDSGTAVAMMGTGRMTVGILDLARPGPQDVALVTSAAGGIGTLLVQALRRAGATVVGAAGGAAKVERVLANGADTAVDYSDPDWAEQVRPALEGREVTLVFDGVGGTVGRAAFDLLGGGRIVLYGMASGEGTRFTSAELLARGISAVVALGALVFRDPQSLRDLEERALGEAAAGRLVPLVQTFPLHEAAAAHLALETRASAGKVVLVP